MSGAAAGCRLPKVGYAAVGERGLVTVASSQPRSGPGPAYSLACGLLRLTATDLRKQLVVQSAEAAVAHDERVIARPQSLREIARERAHVAAPVSAPAQLCEYGASIPTQVLDRKSVV